MSRRLLVLLALAGVAVPLTATAAGYVRTRTGGNSGDGASSGHCLRWPGGVTVSFHLESCAAGQGSDVCAARHAAIGQAVGAWKAALDGCGSLDLVLGTPTLSRQVGYVPGAATNENVVLFRSATCGAGISSGQGDCWDASEATLGLTTTTFQAQTGVILDTDIELNAAQFVLSTVDAPPCPEDAPSQGCVAHDVQNAVTHELGHALGLDHVDDAASTLFPSAGVGELSKRVIDPASAQAMCDVYPSGSPSQDCVATSQGQPLESEAAPSFASLGCHAAVGRDGGDGGWLAIWAWIVLGLFLWRGTRAGRRPPLEG